MSLRWQGAMAGGCSPTACTGDANPHAFMVAIERSSLPAGPFALQLAETDDEVPGCD